MFYLFVICINRLAYFGQDWIKHIEKEGMP